MTTERDRRFDRREFLRAAAATAALGGAYHALGGFPGLIAQPAPATPLPTWLPTVQSGPFHMLVIGDSIMWGQGLNEDSKFSTIVQRWLIDRLPGRAVVKHVFAHSGAHIKANEAEDAHPARAGEVPRDWPSITAQVSMAQKRLADLNVAPEEVGVVLLSGGINDVVITSILTSDPSINNITGDETKEQWIRRLTRERVGPRMKELLSLVLTSFPNAKVVVTSYFPIVSGSTPAEALALLFATIPGFGLAASLVTILTRDRLAGQSRVFNEESIEGLRQAVAEARPLELSTAAVVRRPSGGRPQFPTAQTAVLERPRAAFARVPFESRHCYGAPDSWLWGLKPDQALLSRQQQCQVLGQGLNPWCMYAAWGHPNVRGAREYANAIIDALERLEPAWRTSVPQNLKTTPVPAVPRRITRPPRP
ncbi:MAG TPA: SGNH/GDSL hydrolase family protein [Gemmatimonadaceae bacterium]|nr:SGNH/GDSL hydrolase family protein [Gemmatimonadaceae bacterium]